MSDFFGSMGFGGKLGIKVIRGPNSSRWVKFKTFFSNLFRRSV